MVTDRLQRDAQRVVLRAVAGDERLAHVLVLKGALAAEAITQRPRSTRDIDLTAERCFVSFDRSGEQSVKKWFRECLENHFDSGHDEDWSLSATSAKMKPSRKGRHKHGWDGYQVRVTLLHRGSNQQVIPIDLSFGDFTGRCIDLDCGPGAPRIAGPKPPLFKLRGYSVEEQIGEKLRAFLQRLPQYQHKTGVSHPRPFRVRDVRDIHHLVNVALGSDLGLDWDILGKSFNEKCRAKCVDCHGLPSFVQGEEILEQVESLYAAEFSAPEVPFRVAWTSLERVVDEIGRATGFPGDLPLPTDSGDDSTPPSQALGE